MDLIELVRELEKTKYGTGSLERIEEGQMGDVFSNEDYVFKTRESINEDGMAFRERIENTPAVDAVLKAGSDYIIVEERIKPAQEVMVKDFHQLGQLLARLHTIGRQFKTGERLPKYEYKDRFASWNAVCEQAEGWKAQRAQQAKEKRKTIFDETEHLESLDFDAEPVFFQHRDVIVENIIKSRNQFYITDFEFAALGYRGIELFRFVINGILTYDTSIIEPFLSGYTDESCTARSLKNGLDICLNYFLFNTFPFYLDKDREKIDELADQRDQYLDILIEKFPQISDTIESVC